MYGEMRGRLAATLAEIDAAGLYKHERRLASPQSAHIETVTTDGSGAPGGRAPSLNFCANNYLGLADHPDVIAAAKASYDEWGFGMASVRFICGTQELHKRLERAISEFLGMADAILFS
jgi:glycine C-acetyltransferase